jgi:hypothetical protein
MGRALQTLERADPGTTERLRKMRDFERFVPLCKVRREEGGALVPLQLMPGQRRVLEAIGQHKRVLILKGRRLGITTLKLAQAFHLINSRPFTSAVMVAHRDVDATKIFRAARTMYRGLPPQLQHRRPSTNRREIEFDVMESVLGVGTAGGHGVGRSDTLHEVHLTEASRYTGDVEDMIAGLEEAARRGRITAETTAAGASGWFYETWKKATRGENDWLPVFAPWWWDHRNRVALDDPELGKRLRLSSDEKSWAKGLKREQLLWYRRKARRLGKKMKSEYPCSALEAFQTSGLHFFDQDTVNRKQHAAPKPIAAAQNGRLKIWEHKQEGVKYVIGADPSEGVPHGDFAYASVHRFDTGAQVASYRGRVPPRTFARVLRDMGNLYNRALIAVELNRRECVRSLRTDLGYRFLYYRRSKEGIRDREPGFMTDSRSRPMMLDFFRDAFEGIPGEDYDSDEEIEGWLEIRDGVVFDEMTTFEDQGNGKYAANSGHHDDAVIAVAIALQARNVPQPKARFIDL